MADFEKIETEILSLLSSFKSRFKKKQDNISDIKTENATFSTSDILRTPAQIVTDLANEMDCVKNSHIIKHGNENEADIDKLIKTSLQSFAEYQQTIR